MGLRGWLTTKIVEFLTQPLSRHERCATNDLDALKRHIRKGDVLLVQGDQRVSAIIRYLTQSSWSHTAVYVGDELVQRGGELGEWARCEYGEQSKNLLVEALPDGVTARPIDIYANHRIRVCRPHRLGPDDLKVIMDDALSAIGWQYDPRNVVDLAWHYVPAELIPSRFRSQASRYGSGARAQVICSSLVGELFANVGFPVLPTVSFPDGQPPPRVRPAATQRWLQRLRRRPRDSYPGLFRRLHPSLLAPRDFDLSPYFEVVKFSVIEDGDFDYQLIRWAEDDAEVEAELQSAGSAAALAALAQES